MSNTIIDNATLDKLVDGELSGDDRREVLLALEKQEQGWRSCALAFLEAQSWGQNFQQIIDTPATSTEIDPQRRGRHWLQPVWLSLAAGLLVAFTLGWLARPLLVPASGSAAPVTEQVAVIETPSAIEPWVRAEVGEEPALERDGDVLNLYVRDQTGKAHSLAIPLVDADTLDEQLGLEFRTGIPADVRRKLEAHGYQVNSRRRYAPLWTEGGRPFVLPVEDTQIVPVSGPVY